MPKAHCRAGRQPGAQHLSFKGVPQQGPEAYSLGGQKSTTLQGYVSNTLMCISAVQVLRCH